MTFLVSGLKIRTNEFVWEGAGPGENVTDFELSMSTSSSVKLMASFIDTPDHRLERMPGLRQDGVEVTFGGRKYTMLSFKSGGDDEKPTVSLNCISQTQAALAGGDIDPEFAWTKNVPGWLEQVMGLLPEKRHRRVIDGNLGDKQVEAEANPGDGATEAETLWDTIHETAKRCGAWCWVDDRTFFFGKPSWLVDRGDQNEWQIKWDDWGNHTSGLLAKPDFGFDLSKKTWEGRESLSLRFVDPEEVVTDDRLARNMRPGDRLTYKGKAAPSDPVWIITDVTRGISNVDPVEVTCWRPVDPPEIIDDNGSSSGAGGEAGVPSGPIGAGKWDGEQLVNASEIVKEGQRRKLPMTALQLAVLTAMGESTLINVSHGDAAGPDSTGLFQQRDSWGSVSDRRTPSKAAGFFYDALLKTPYEDTYNNGGASVVFGGSYGPGKSANSASLAVHNVQRNSNPLHYAQMMGGTMWDDAKLVVQACIDAGTSSSGGGDGKVPSGPLGERMQRSINSMNGRTIDHDGAFGGQCADVSMKYAKDLWGIGMVIGNGKDYWRNPQIMPYCQALPPSAAPRYGDIMSWSGSGGAYANGGYGHVAIYISGNPGSGTVQTLSQNPGPARMQPLSVSGLLGWMRPVK